MVKKIICIPLTVLLFKTFDFFYSFPIYGKGLRYSDQLQISAHGGRGIGSVGNYYVSLHLQVIGKTTHFALQKLNIKSS